MPASMSTEPAESVTISQDATRRLAIYVVTITGVLMLVAVLATIAVGMWWMRTLEPVSDGQRVLEIKAREAREVSPD